MRDSKLARTAGDQNPNHSKNEVVLRLCKAEAELLELILDHHSRAAEHNPWASACRTMRWKLGRAGMSESMLAG
jgi:hypothetical protein